MSLSLRYVSLKKKEIINFNYSRLRYKKNRPVHEKSDEIETAFRLRNISFPT